MVKERIIKHGSSWSTSWNWCRPLMGRTTLEYDELQNILSEFRFADSDTDTWSWSLSRNGSFSSYILRELIDDRILNTNAGNEETLRNKLLPQNIEILVWRAQRNRLPIRLELDKKGIDLDSVRCPVCDEDLESLEHILLTCKHAKDIWSRVYRWWGKSQPTKLNISELFKGSTESSNVDPNSNIWQTIIWVSAYKIWQNRNNKIFRNSFWTVPMAFQEIQTSTFEWISNRSKAHKFSWQRWISTPNVFGDHG
ncbi:uncharacterized protein [Rutidosis leptorrhynchoides]|uniref:uncharacterized protein n=1 Tax=Rutidosis leptorrhynchoides TaxID=125765 RepID=UPI003A999791